MSKPTFFAIHPIARVSEVSKRIKIQISCESSRNIHVLRAFHTNKLIIYGRGIASGSICMSRNRNESLHARACACVGKLGF